MKITIDREVVEQVLNSLERYQVKRQDERFADEITALQEALAQPQQEPVAIHQWRKPMCCNWYDGHPDPSDGGAMLKARETK